CQSHLLVILFSFTPLTSTYTYSLSLHDALPISTPSPYFFSSDTIKYIFPLDFGKKFCPPITVNIVCFLNESPIIFLKKDNINTSLQLFSYMITEKEVNFT